MQLILSHYGHRWMQHRDRAGGVVEGDPDAPLFEAMRAIWRHTLVPWRDEDDVQAALIARGLAERVDDATPRAQVKQRYKRNPLEHVERIVFEYTTLCQLNCLHCRNGHIKPVTEGRTDRLKAVVDRMIPLGVRRFDFIGGEVTLYGRGWLEVVEHIRGYAETTALVLTSGWFLEERDFFAAGARYSDDMAYLRALQARGVTHVVFSVDGPEDLHDRWRQVLGLYRRIVRGIAKVREAGLTPGVSVVISDAVTQHALGMCLLELAEALYTFGPGDDADRRVRRLLNDPINYVSNLIDVGNGATDLVPKSFEIDAVPDALLRCKNFFRPHPSLRIQANGELSLCPLIDAGQGYGNVRERDFIDVLNTMHEAFIFKLHAERRIADYRSYLDRDLFGDRIEHVCSLRTVVAMLAKAIEASGIDPDTDAEGLRRLNEVVARRAGFLPARGPTATGVKRPT